MWSLIFFLSTVCFSAEAPPSPEAIAFLQDGMPVSWRDLGILAHDVQKLRPLAALPPSTEEEAITLAALQEKQDTLTLAALQQNGVEAESRYTAERICADCLHVQEFDNRLQKLEKDESRVARNKIAKVQDIYYKKDFNARRKSSVMDPLKQWYVNTKPVHKILLQRKAHILRVRQDLEACLPHNSSEQRYNDRIQAAYDDFKKALCFQDRLKAFWNLVQPLPAPMFSLTRSSSTPTIAKALHPRPIRTSSAPTIAAKALQEYPLPPVAAKIHRTSSAPAIAHAIQECSQPVASDTRQACLTRSTEVCPEPTDTSPCAEEDDSSDPIAFLDNILCAADDDINRQARAYPQEPFDTLSNIPPTAQAHPCEEEDDSSGPIALLDDVLCAADADLGRQECAHLQELFICNTPNNSTSATQTPAERPATPSPPPSPPTQPRIIGQMGLSFTNFSLKATDRHVGLFTTNVQENYTALYQQKTTACVIL